MPDNIIDLTLKVADDGSVTIDKFNQKIKTLGTNATAAGGTPGGGGIAGLASDFGLLINPTTIAIGAITGMAVAAKEFIEIAAEAEKIESRMAFQVEQVGYNFKDAQPYIDQFANSILQAGRFSDEAAREGLGRMMQYTNDLGKATNGVQLAMDISTQTGKGYEEMITLVGMAMNGNVERLGRWVPELKNLEDKLEKNATAAEKSEYAMKILNERFGGAAQKDLETYAGKMANLKNQLQEQGESIGRSLMPTANSLLSVVKWHVDFWTGNGPFKSVEKLIQEEKAAWESWRKTEAQRKVLQGAAGREESYKAMIKAAEEAYKIEQEYAKKRAQLRGNEYELLAIEMAEELEKVRKAKGDEYYVWEYYDQKKIDLDKKTADKLQAVWLEYYEKQKSNQDKAIGVANLYGVPTTASMTMDFKQFEKDWGEALKGPLTKNELDEIQKAIIANAQAYKEYFGSDKGDALFKKTVENIEKMRKEADIAAGTQYRMQFDDAAVVQAVDELEAVTEWLKYICEENKWQVKVKFITEGGEDIQRVLDQLQAGGGQQTSSISVSYQDLDTGLANMVSKNQSKLSRALRKHR